MSTNYFNTLSLRDQLAQLGKCRFMHLSEFGDGVNALKGKQLTNVRASGTDEAQSLVPPINMSLEQALEFIDNDELVEVTPVSIRIRKKLLTENLRKQAGRPAKV